MGGNMESIMAEANHHLVEYDNEENEQILNEETAKARLKRFEAGHALEALSSPIEGRSTASGAWSSFRREFNDFAHVTEEDFASADLPPAFPPNVATGIGYRNLLIARLRLQDMVNNDCNSAQREHLSEAVENLKMNPTPSYTLLQRRFESLFYWPSLLARSSPITSVPITECFSSKPPPDSIETMPEFDEEEGTIKVIPLKQKNPDQLSSEEEISSGDEYKKPEALPMYIQNHMRKVKAMKRAQKEKERQERKRKVKAPLAPGHETRDERFAARKQRLELEAMMRDEDRQKQADIQLNVLKPVVHIVPLDDYPFPSVSGQRAFALAVADRAIERARQEELAASLPSHLSEETVETVAAEPVNVEDTEYPQEQRISDQCTPITPKAASSSAVVLESSEIHPCIVEEVSTQHETSIARDLNSAMVENQTLDESVLISTSLVSTGTLSETLTCPSETHQLSTKKRGRPKKQPEPKGDREVALEIAEKAISRHQIETNENEKSSSDSPRRAEVVQSNEIKKKSLAERAIASQKLEDVSSKRNRQKGGTPSGKKSKVDKLKAEIRDRLRVEESGAEHADDEGQTANEDEANRPSSSSPSEPKRKQQKRTKKREKGEKGKKQKELPETPNFSTPPLQRKRPGDPTEICAVPLKKDKSITDDKNTPSTSAPVDISFVATPVAVSTVIPSSNTEENQPQQLQQQQQVVVNLSREQILQMLQQASGEEVTFAVTLPMTPQSKPSADHNNPTK